MSGGGEDDPYSASMQQSVDAGALAGQTANGAPAITGLMQPGLASAAAPVSVQSAGAAPLAGGPNLMPFTALPANNSNQALPMQSFLTALAQIEAANPIPAIQSVTPMKPTKSPSPVPLSGTSTSTGT